MGLLPLPSYCSVAEVESSRSCRLVEADDDVFYEFAHRIGYYLHLHHGVGSESDDEGSSGDGDASPPTGR